jgi:hypothetical protein
MKSPWERDLDPKLEELLTELSADPHSTLLKVPVSMKELGVQQVSARAADLSAAERELLSVFRFELRDLLLEACRRELYSLRGLQVSRWRSWDARLHVSTEDAWRASARRALEDIPDEVEARDALTLLSSCVAHPNSPPPTVSQLAGAAQRVMLDDRAPVYAALELIGDESPRAAMSLLYGVLEDRPDVSLRSYCWQNLGVCHHRLGDLTGALQCHERAMEGGDLRPAPLLSAFALALAVEETERASEHARELEARMGIDHPGLDEELGLLQDMTAAEDAAVHDSRKNTYQVIEDRLGSVSRRIGYALFS